MNVTKMLKGHELFRSMRFEDVDRINSFSAIRELREGETIFESGAVGTHIYVLLDGSINLRLPARTRDTGLVAGLIEKGDIFGLAPLLGSQRYKAGAHCASPSKVISIEAGPLREMLKQESATGFHVMSVAARAYFTRYLEVLRRVQNAMSDIAAI